MSYKFCTETDTGRVRHNNEDAAVVDASLGLAVLADGMGGYNAGEVASGMATQLICHQLGHWLSQRPADLAGADIRLAMQTCIDQVNQSILNLARQEVQYAGMGTTLVVAVFLRNLLVLGHIGDSRCYRWRQGHFMQITRDHSLLQAHIDAGVLTPQQAAVSSQKNLITRALGVEAQVVLELNEYWVEANDVYLMCTDGLSDMVSDADISAILAQPVPLAQQAQRLIELANANGGRDNITVLLVQAPSGHDG